MGYWKETFVHCFENVRRELSCTGSRLGIGDCDVLGDVFVGSDLLLYCEFHYRSELLIF